MAVKAKAPRKAEARIASALRKLWLWSPERGAALKRAKIRPGVYACEVCRRELFLSAKKGEPGEKRPRPHVHHIDGVTWKEIYRLVIEQLLVDASRLLVVCKQCHKDIHRGGK